MDILEKAVKILEEMIFCKGYKFSNIKDCNKTVKTLLKPFMCKNINNSALVSKGTALFAGLEAFINKNKQKFNCMENLTLLERMFKTRKNPSEDKKWAPWVKYQELRALAQSNARAMSKTTCPKYYQYSLVSF
jgi:hypothetical protein